MFLIYGEILNGLMSLVKYRIFNIRKSNILISLRNKRPMRFNPGATQAGAPRRAHPGGRTQAGAHGRTRAHARSIFGALCQAFCAKKIFEKIL